MSTLGDTIDQLHPVHEIRACQDCPCCYVVTAWVDAAELIRCSADPHLRLVNGQLGRRHPDCPRAGTSATWPEGKGS